MCRLRMRINPSFADHPYMKHKVQSTTQCVEVCEVCASTTKLKQNFTVDVPDEIPSEDWLTFNEFIVKCLLIGVIYLCLIIIVKFSRNFMYWSESPRRQVKTPNNTQRYSEKLVRVLNFMLSPSSALLEFEIPPNEAQLAATSEVPSTQTTTSRIVTDTDK